MLQKITIINFHCHIWNQHEKCIKMSTNKPSIGAVVLEITPMIFKQNTVINDLHAGYRFVSGKFEFDHIFAKIQGAISRTTAPIQGLLVLILVHFLCWIQIWQWNFKFWIFLKKFENFSLSSALNIRMEKRRLNNSPWL